MCEVKVKENIGFDILIVYLAVQSMIKLAQCLLKRAKKAKLPYTSDIINVTLASEEWFLNEDI